MRTLESADDAEYALSKLDMSSMASHITGGIDVIVRPADMLLQQRGPHVRPLGIDLMRRLSYGAVPDSVKGSVEGRLVAATGGPLTRFAIDRLDARFLDARVPGAVSTVRASGMVGLGVEPTAHR